MTVEDYFDVVKALGLRLLRKTSSGEEWLARNKNGDFTIVPDPDALTPEERDDTIILLKARHGGLDC